MYGGFKLDPGNRPVECVRRSSPSYKIKSDQVEILLLEDNRADFVFVREVLATAGSYIGFTSYSYNVSWASSLDSALALLDEKNFNIILADLSLPDASGLKAFYSLSDAAPDIPIVVLTGTDNESLASEAINGGAQDYLVKGELDGKVLVRCLLHAIERHEVLKQLEEAKRDALAATKFKTDFLSSMSHEIRTPLTPIVGFADALRDPNLPPSERLKAVDIIGRSCGHLLRIVNDVLDLSKIEAGKMPIQMSACSPFNLLSEITDLMRAKADEKGIHLQIDYKFPLPKIIVTDEARLKQILMNLIGNGIKFTRAGSVMIALVLDIRSETLKFSVKDTGIGLSAKEQSVIFNPFSQANESTLTQFGGTGLGLTISKELAIRLGGSLSMTSQLGKGSTFELIIPAGIRDENELVYEAPVVVPQAWPRIETVPSFLGRVLLAEDGIDNRILISYLLRKCGIEPRVVENEKLAVDTALNEGFDLILMDVQMPIMNGYEATKTLRAKGCKTPIIALTAKVMKADVEACFQAGFTDHLAKPFEGSSFYSKLSKYLRCGEEKEEPLSAKLEETSPEYVRIILDFIDRLPATMIEIEKAFRNCEWEELEVLGHRLRSSALFGYPILSDAAADLETSASGKNKKEVENKITRVASIIKRIVAAKERIASLAGGPKAQGSSSR